MALPAACWVGTAIGMGACKARIVLGTWAGFPVPCHRSSLAGQAAAGTACLPLCSLAAGDVGTCCGAELLASGVPGLF